MSLFNEFKQSASVYHADVATGKTSYPATADITLDLVIQTMSPEDRMVFGDTLGEYVTHTTNSSIVRGDKIISGGRTYFVTDTPTYINLFKRYKIFLRAERQ